MIQEVLEIVREQARTTQESLATAQRVQIQNIDGISPYRIDRNPFVPPTILGNLYGMSVPTRETLLTGSFPKGTNISDYDPPSEDTVGLGPAIDPESPQRDE